MSDRIKGVVVTFDRDLREEDCADIVRAIGMIRGVVSAEPSVATIDDHMARVRVREELIADVAGLIRGWRKSP